MVSNTLCVFGSPERKVQVSFYNHPLSVVRPSVRPPTHGLLRRPKRCSKFYTDLITGTMFKNLLHKNYDAAICEITMQSF